MTASGRWNSSHELTAEAARRLLAHESVEDVLDFLTRQAKTLEEA